MQIKRKQKKRNQELLRLRNILKKRIFYLLPKPPLPSILQLEPEVLQPIFINDALFLGSGKKQEIINLENYEDDSLKSWVNQLEDNKRVYWNLLSKREKNEYLFFFNELNKKSSKIQAKIKKKKAKKLVMTKKRVKSGISKLGTSDALKVIGKKLANEKNEKWDYKKTDWDVT